MGIASERIRRFNRPIDPSGSGRIVAFLGNNGGSTRPANDQDYGSGFDSKGLPVGLQLIGKPFEEETLLRIAHAAEPSEHKLPPLAEGR